MRRGNEKKLGIEKEEVGTGKETGNDKEETEDVMSAKERERMRNSEIEIGKEKKSVVSVRERERMKEKKKKD